MRVYHEIWLQAHPTRTREWLEQHLKDGFDIHHIDGNHENNNPKNLLLCESSDHMQLHGLPLTALARTAAKRRKVPLDRETVRDIFIGLRKGIKASELKRITGLSRQTVYLITTRQLHSEWTNDIPEWFD